MLRDHWREFPRELDAPEQLPPPMLRILQEHISNENEIIHLYLIPQPRGFWDWFHDAPPRNSIFCLTPQLILIAREEPTGAHSTEVCLIEDILAFEIGTVLLRSWITLSVRSREIMRKITLQYGTVFSRQFRDSILWLRALLQPGNQPPRHAWRMPGEEHISALPLKFNNAARSFWLDGEIALASCFISPLTRSMRIINRLQRPYSNATAIVVSNEEVCVIEEQTQSATGRWGQTWHFFSLGHISSSETITGERFPAVHFQLCDGGALSRPTTATGNPVLDVQIPFAPNQQHDIDRVLAAVNTQRVRYAS